MLRVANPKAAMEDRPLYQRLFDLTALHAQAAIRDAMARVTSEEATKEFVSQLEELQAFLLEQPGRQGDGTARQIVAEGLAPLLRETLADDPDSEALCRDLSQEFARVLWGGLLRQMRLGSSTRDGRVERRDILPEADGADDGWKDVYLAVEQYGLTQAEVLAVLKGVLSELAAGEPGDRIKLPLGLHIDKAMLTRTLEGQPESGAFNDVLKRTIDFFR